MVLVLWPVVLRLGAGLALWEYRRFRLVVAWLRPFVLFFASLCFHSVGFAASRWAVFFAALWWDCLCCDVSVLLSLVALSSPNVFPVFATVRRDLCFSVTPLHIEAFCFVEPVDDGDVVP